MDIPGKLSTIPKGWHQPLSEASSEAKLSTTLLRELEEELLGREDLEQMSDESRRTADPLHQERQPEAHSSAAPDARRADRHLHRIRNQPALRHLRGALPRHHRRRALVGRVGPPDRRQLGNDQRRDLLVHGHRRPDHTPPRPTLEQRRTLLPHPRSPVPQRKPSRRPRHPAKHSCRGTQLNRRPRPTLTYRTKRVRSP